MNISPIVSQQFKNINNVNSTNRCAVPIKAQYDTVSFGSAKSREAFQMLDGALDMLLAEKGATSKNKKAFASLIRKALPSIMEKDNYINGGNDSNVYKISDKYVAKVKKTCTPDNAVHFYNKTHLPKRPFRHLDCYYGETQAKIGNVEILKNATPNEADFSCGCGFDLEEFANATEILASEKKVPQIRQIPQEGYDKLAQNLSELNEHNCRKITIWRKKQPKYIYPSRKPLIKLEKIEINGIGRKHSFVPDIINPNNIVVSGDEFRIVDEFRKVPCYKPNTIYTMLTPILLKIKPNAWSYSNEKLYDARKDIFKKILIAAEKSKLPLAAKSRHDGYAAKCTLNDILGDKSSETGIGTNVISKMREMRRQGLPLEERLKKLEENFEKWTTVKKEEQTRVRG